MYKSENYELVSHNNGMRRSVRIRNRVHGLSDNSSVSSGSYQNLNMARNTFNNNLRNLPQFNAESNPNLFDLLPHDGMHNVFNEVVHYNAQYRQKDKIYHKIFQTLLIFIITVIITVCIAINVTLLYEESTNLELIYKNVNEISRLESNLSYLNNLHNRIHHLNKKLKEVDAVLNEMIKWRETFINSNEEYQNKIIQRVSNHILNNIDSKIEQALTLYDSDKVGMTDYALESAGGFVTSIPETTAYPSQFSYVILGVINIQYPSNPRMLIEPGILPGQCFAFYGHHGRIRIQLAHIIKITAVTLEHTYMNLVSDIKDVNSAPRTFKVYGLSSSKIDVKDELGYFEYKIDQKPLQTFWIEPTKKYYGHVELEILTNHGNLDYTCVYRFRVHGSK